LGGTTDTNPRSDRTYKNESLERIGRVGSGIELKIMECKIDA
jgi:hypothetical protein